MLCERKGKLETMTLSERLEALENGAFWRLLGMKVLSAKDGQAIVTMPVQEDILQLYGIVHGGALATLVDGAIGAAVQSTLAEDEAATTIDLQVFYDRPGKSERLTAASHLVKRGKTVIFGEARVTDEQGELIVHGHATYMVLKHDRWTKP